LFRLSSVCGLFEIYTGSHIGNRLHVSLANKTSSPRTQNAGASFCAPPQFSQSWHRVRLTRQFVTSQSCNFIHLRGPKSLLNLAKCFPSPVSGFDSARFCCASGCRTNVSAAFRERFASNLLFLWDMRDKSSPLSRMLLKCSISLSEQKRCSLQNTHASAV